MTKGVRVPMEIFNHPAKWWQALPEGRIECRVCPRLCRLRAGQRGFCFARQNIDGSMVLTAYGRSSGFCLDPIEKKPLFHFYPGSCALSFGTAGCNLGCRFCQNWDITKAGSMNGLGDQTPPERIAAAAVRLGCRSVAFTYNDPVVFAEYAMNVADACHRVGLAAVAVTAGYMTDECRVEFYGHMDAANVDLKGFTEDFYRRNCAGQLAPVLATLRHLHHNTNVWLEVTTLLIPGENDSDGELENASDWFAAQLGPDVPWHFTAFHPDYKMLDKPGTSSMTLSRACDIARSKGIRYVYTGNTRDLAENSTWCPQCGQRLIGRVWHDVVEWNLSENSCNRCRCRIPGHFDPLPGRWGNRSVRICVA